MTTTTIGFIGLGNMGRPMASNLAAGGHALTVFDAAGTADRAPECAPDAIALAASIAEVAAAAEPAFLSLPDGAAVLDVCAEIASAPGRVTRTVVDLSTIGIDAAEAAARRLAAEDIDYLDAPVSGGVAGARAATLSMMLAGDPDAIARVEPLLALMAVNRFVVGREPGLGQAMKLLNNFLSATTLAATSEAIRFGERRGLDMATMLDVLNTSSGQSNASTHKFPRAVLPGTFDLGFTARLMAKDAGLYRAAARDLGAPAAIAEVVAALWQAMAADDPSADFSRMYDFVEREADAQPRE